MKTIDTKPEFPIGVYDAVDEPGCFSPFSYNKTSNKIKRAGTNGGFYVCREEFLHYSFKGLLKQFLFTHESKDFPKIEAFFEDLQNTLKLSLENRVQIRPTKNPTISMVFVSKWWNANIMRRAFLTIALRAGWNYNVKKTDLRKAMYENEYFKETPKATEAFLKGRTVVLDNPRKNEGWVNNFSSDIDYRNDLEVEVNLKHLVFEQ